jgi:predicted HAD superfamily phosphohydrolase YqeG
VIGDQLFTDVLGGNRLGLFTILVQPIDQREFIGTRLVRQVERRVLAWLRKRGWLS